MGSLGRGLIGLGLIIVVVGFVFLAAERFHLPLGRLPGDFSHQGKNVRVYFPLGTSILISVILSLILWLIGRFRG
jgi:Protein of unknown function (DUF2905)